MELSAALLKLLVCPVTGSRLIYEPSEKILISKKAGLVYPIIDGIPMLLESAAKKLK